MKNKEKMSNEKNILLGLLVLFSILISMGLASAWNFESGNITVTPANGAVIGGTASINCTFDSLYAIAGANYPLNGQFNFTIQSAGSTANTSYNIIANSSGGNYNYTSGSIGNSTIRTNLMEDGSDYTVTCYLSNGTSTVSASSTGVIIDNGIPPAPTLSPASNQASPQTASINPQTFTATVNSLNTTSCPSYAISRGGASSGNDYISGNTTYSAGTSFTSCTFTKSFTATTDNGDWYWTVTASDGRNSTSSVTNHFVFAKAASSGGLPDLDGDGTLDTQIPTLPTPPEGSTWLLWAFGIVFGLIIIGIIIYFAT